MTLCLESIDLFVFLIPKSKTPTQHVVLMQVNTAEEFLKIQALLNKH